MTGSALRIASLFAVAAGLATLVACGTAPLDTAATGADTAPIPATSTPMVQTDVFVQDLAPEIDLLFVLDDTAGASALRAELADSFPVFLDFFLGSGRDWHLGVVTTDLVDPDESGRLHASGAARWIDPTTPDPVGRFEGLVEALAGPDAPTTGRDAAFAALDTLAATDNAGFARPTADLAVITVSPADDASTGIALDAWFTWLDAARGDPTRVSHHTIGAPAGSAYETVTASVGGVSCAGADFACIQQLGVAAAGYQQAYALSETPVPASIAVDVTEGDVDYAFTSPDDWTWDAATNVVRFVEYVPNVGAEVRITYVVAP